MTTSADTSREFATDVVRHLRAAGYVALWAGGCVRDYLMGRTAQDFDVATNATPEQVRDLFGKRRTLAVGQSFGVIIVLPTGKEATQVEVATFRTEGVYLDGRRPSEVIFSTPEEDAQRRDFTINGMFYDPIEERVLDYVSGQLDLKRKILRAIGDPHERMTEDKLRMLRAVRFAATLEFTLDERTLTAVKQMAPEMIVVSAERIAQELRKVLAHRTRVRGFQLLAETRLLHVIFPEVNLADSQTTADILNQLPTNTGFELATAAILHQITAPVSEPRTEAEARGTVWAMTRRLKLSAEEMTSIAWLVAHLDCWNDAEQQSDAQLKRVLAHPLSGDLRALIRAIRKVNCLPLSPIQFVDEYADRHTPEQINPPELISGRDLIQQGLHPGPQFKLLLETLRDAQLNGEIATREEALERLQRVMLKTKD
jgi:poly(A) polymerase